MIKYRLKKEARQFFEEKHHTKIMTLKSWEQETISERLLDEVDKVYIDYGIKANESRTDLCGWSSNEGEPNAHYKFTIRVNDITNKDYESVKIADVLDEIQKVLNRFFKRYED